MIKKIPHQGVEIAPKNTSKFPTPLVLEIISGLKSSVTLLEIINIKLAPTGVTNRKLGKCE
jgi:hypothetical protein